MKPMNTINAIDFTVLAQITKDNKSAGIIMMMALQSMNDGQVTMTPKSLSEATGLDRKNITKALKHLVTIGVIQLAQDCTAAYLINDNLVRIENPRLLTEAEHFPELTTSLQKTDVELKPKREVMRVVDRMNAMTDMDIADACFPDDAVAA